MHCSLASVQIGSNAFSNASISSVIEVAKRGPTLKCTSSELYSFGAKQKLKKRSRLESLRFL